MADVYATLLIDSILLVLVAASCVAVVLLRSLFSATMLAGIYSLLMALVWSNMHALDVAFTEAAVGAGISTVLLLGAVVRVGRYSKPRQKLHAPALIVCLVTGAMLIYGTLDMPNFGDPNAPIHNVRVPKLVDQRVGKSPTRRGPELGHGHADPAHPHPDDDFGGHSPNTVTSLLASYRGYDTMYETAVIFTAGISMVLLLRRRREEKVPPREDAVAARAAEEGIE